MFRTTGLRPGDQRGGTRVARLSAGMGIRDPVPDHAGDLRSRVWPDISHPDDHRRRADPRSAVVLAMDVTYTQLGLPALEQLLGRGVFYGASPAEAKQLEGGRVFLVGAGNSAGQAALHLAKWAREVTLVVRGDWLAKSMSAYLIHAIASAKNISVRLCTRIVDGSGARALRASRWRTRPGDHRSRRGRRPLRAHWRPSPHELASTGHQDRCARVCRRRDGPRHDKLLDDWPLVRTPQHFETSVPGIFAVGDVRSRSLKRVASSAGEGAVVIGRFITTSRRRRNSKGHAGHSRRA